MSVQLQWHPTLPILIATYPPVLSAKEYDLMCRRRQALLDKGPETVIVLADVRALSEFPDAPTLKHRDTALAHPRVLGLLVVLAAEFYRRLAPAILPVRMTPHRVEFFWDMDTALSQADARLRAAGHQS